MSTEESVMTRMIGRDREFVVVTKNSIIKLDVITTVDTFVNKIEEFIIEGEYQNAIKWLHRLKDSKLFVMRGISSEAKEIISTQRIEQYIRSDLERKMREEGSLGSLQEAYDTLIQINSELSLQDRRDLIKKGISFWILNEKELFPEDTNIKKDEYNVWAIKFIPTYIMDYYLSDRKQGQVERPECYMGVKLRVLGKTLSVSETVVIIHPSSYPHPFVYSGNRDHRRICMGSAAQSIKNRMSKTTSILKLVELLFNEGERIIKYGYNKDKGDFFPAGKHLDDAIYNPFRKSNKASAEYWEREKAREKGSRKIQRNGVA